MYRSPQAFFFLKPVINAFLNIQLINFLSWLCWVSVAAPRLSLAGASRRLLLVAVCGLLTVVASAVADHGLSVPGLQ